MTEHLKEIAIWVGAFSASTLILAVYVQFFWMLFQAMQ